MEADSGGLIGSLVATPAGLQIPLISSHCLITRFYLSLLRMDTHHRTDGKRMAEIPLVMHECVECRRRDPAGVLTCPQGHQSEGRCGLEVHLHPEGLV